MINANQPHWMLSKIAEETAPGSTIDLWPRIERNPTYRRKTHNPSPSRSLRFASGMVVLALILALTLAVSPVVRAQVQTWVGEIGGVLFTADGDYPGDDEPVTTVASESMSLDKARETLGLTLSLPSWVPTGYVLQDEVSVPHFDDRAVRVEITWTAPEKPSIMLNIERYPEGSKSNWLVGPESIEEVLVNGEPAGLVRGFWNADRKQWDNADGLSLYWQVGDQYYILRGFGEDISVEDLIRMAESIP